MSDDWWATPAGVQTVLREEIKIRNDRIEELEDKLNWVIVERDETFALMLDRAQTAEAKLAKVTEALEGVMIGGNHLAVWLPDDHPTADAEPLAALEQIGAGVSFDVWCCWRAIMSRGWTSSCLPGSGRCAS